MFLIVDNYDSFVYNLVQFLGELGISSDVHRNDAIKATNALTLVPEAIVISPGPGVPDHAGMCLELVQEAANTGIPVLGVCLGHQVLGQAFGGKVVRAPEPMHGKMSDIHHTNSGVFKGLPNPFSATRYHSLVVERSNLPEVFEITAETSDGLIMGLQHKKFPFHGVQFHPESITSAAGHDLLSNFIVLATGSRPGRCPVHEMAV